MARVLLIIDPDGMDEALSTARVKRALEDIGNDIAGVAKSNMSSHYTGPLGYTVDVAVRKWFGAYGSHRAIGFVRTTHQLGPALERKYAPLRNARDQVGLWISKPS